jgi:hypothetical protein
LGLRSRHAEKFTIGLIALLKIKLCAERRYQTKGQFSDGAGISPWPGDIPVWAIRSDKSPFIRSSKAALYLKITIISKVFANDLARVPAIEHYCGEFLQQEILNRAAIQPADWQYQQ